MSVGGAVRHKDGGYEGKSLFKKTKMTVNLKEKEGTSTVVLNYIQQIFHRLLLYKHNYWV